MGACFGTLGRVWGQVGLNVTWEEDSPAKKAQVNLCSMLWIAAEAGLALDSKMEVRCSDAHLSFAS